MRYNVFEKIGKIEARSWLIMLEVLALKSQLNSYIQRRLQSQRAEEKDKNIPKKYLSALLINTIEHLLPAKIQMPSPKQYVVLKSQLNEPLLFFEKVANVHSSTKHVLQKPRQAITLDCLALLFAGSYDSTIVFGKAYQILQVTLLF